MLSKFLQHINCLGGILIQLTSKNLLKYKNDFYCIDEDFFDLQITNADIRLNLNSNF